MKLEIQKFTSRDCKNRWCAPHPYQLKEQPGSNGSGTIVLLAYDMVYCGLISPGVVRMAETMAAAKRCRWRAGEVRPTWWRIELELGVSPYHAGHCRTTALHVGDEGKSQIDDSYRGCCGRAKCNLLRT
jgi:hypothetical protein